MKRFHDKTVLITGGNSGIGLAAAIQFDQEGARVLITGRDQATLDETLSRLGTGAAAFRTDASDPEAIKALARHFEEQDIKLDAMFVNAGIARFAPLEAIDQPFWEAIFDVNVKGAFFAIQALTPLLNSGASIVLNGSINAHIGMPNSSVYAASKAALISLARTLSAELITRNIRVNVVSPGPVATPLYGRMGFSDKQMAEMAAGIEAQIPVKRFGTPDEVASAVLYLASTQAAFIVGSELVVDGGMSQL